MNIQRRQSSLSIVFISIGVVMTFIAIGIASRIWFDIKQQRITDLNYTNSVIKRYYELGFNQWRNTLLTLGERLIEIEGPDKDSIRLEVVNAAIKNYEELLAFGFASPEGNVLTFSNSSLNDSLPNLMESKNSRRSFIKAKEAERISIGESYYFDNVKDWILPLRVPIRDKNGGLLAVNTTALEYKVLINELNSFGFNPNYKVHLVNDDFNTNQFYYPLPMEDYPNILQKDANIYNNSTETRINNISYLEATNNYEEHTSLIVKSQLEGFNHTLYVTVNKNVLFDDMKGIASIIFIIYLVLILALVSMYRYTIKKEKEYLSVLIESEANLKSIFESTDNIIGLFNKEKKIIEFNAAFFNTVKITDNKEMKKGMALSQLTDHSEMVALFDTLQDRALQGEKFKETIAYPGPKGSTLYYLLSYNPIFQGSEITGLSLFVEDVTELKNYQMKLEDQTNNLERIVKERTQELEGKNQQLEQTLIDLKSAQQKLVQAEKMASLGVLSAGIGHEINNPLNFIKNGTSALIATLESQKEVNLDEIEPFFKIINDGVNRANSIVKSLSHFSRQVKTMDEDCQINDIIDNCLTILNNKLKDKVEIVKNFDHNCPIIKGNEGKLHQAMLNLITNAEQAIDETGKIELTTSFNENELIVEIKDNGMGISKENIAKIADPFFTTKEPGEGTGLGLFITYTIIEEHNGQINVSSKVEEGTTFKMIFNYI